jgi:hypothetical protein
MLKKVLALLIAADGVLTALFGHRFLRWLRQRLPFPMPPVATWLLRWPEALLRGGGAFQALIGGLAFGWLARRARVTTLRTRPALFSLVRHSNGRGAVRATRTGVNSGSRRK